MAQASGPYCEFPKGQPRFFHCRIISGFEMRAWCCFARNKGFQCIPVTNLRHHNVSQAPLSPTLASPEVKVHPRTIIVIVEPTLILGLLRARHCPKAHKTRRKPLLLPSFCRENFAVFLILKSGEAPASSHTFFLDPQVDPLILHENNVFYQL